MAIAVSVDPRINALTWKIIKCAMSVHSALGPGLLESAYLACMVVELRHAGLRVDVAVKVPLLYRELTLDCGYTLDLLVENIVILELKAMAALLPVHAAQLLTYLKLTGKPIGLLINFNVPMLKDGIVRRINTRR
ncbi:MAG TPA: GxxExxY protein [Vicinamibacterales bacterium]|jgi:GxxExxY protein|nr:GxxExxY protein [Vicinamibacterales bacterium]